MAKLKITKEEKKRIEEAVISVEKKTIGEIVPVILKESDDYPGAKLRSSIFFAFVFSFGTYWFFPFIDPLWYIASLIPGGVLGYLLANIRFLKRIFLNKKEMAEEVHQKAIQAFYYLDLASTNDRTGVLLFVSILEHRVEILADKGINQKLEDGTWQEILEHLITQIKKGNLAKGIVQAVEEIGEPLSKHFPKSPDNEDELPNRVIIDL